MDDIDYGDGLRLQTPGRRTKGGGHLRRRADAYVAQPGRTTARSPPATVGSRWNGRLSGSRPEAVAGQVERPDLCSPCLKFAGTVRGTGKHAPAGVRQADRRSFGPRPCTGELVAQASTRRWLSGRSSKPRDAVIIPTPRDLSDNAPGRPDGRRDCVTVNYVVVGVR